MITPTDATLAVLAGAPDPTPGAAPTGAADFLAAILQALAPGAVPGAADAAEPGAGEQGAADPDAADPDSPATTAADAAALGLALAAAVPGVAPGAVPAVAPPLAPGHANVAAVAAGDATGTTGDIRMSADAAQPTAAASTPGDVPVAPGQANVAVGAAEDPKSTTSDIRMSGDAAAPADPATPATPAAPAASVSAAPGATPTATQAPAPTSTGQTAHVTRQVIPDVTSLFSRGEGTHRITLTLKPEALGEVRVVMTVRDGAVHVRLAAGHEAQRALIDGSPELHRVLELAGAHETRVVVRDLGSATPAAQTGSGTDLTQGFAAGHDRHDAHQDQHAGTRAQHPATDGTNPRTTRGTTGASQPRSVEPGTHIRTAGVDVSM